MGYLGNSVLSRRVDARSMMGPAWTKATARFTTGQGVDMAIQLFVIFASPGKQVALGTCYLAPDASTTMLSSKAARFYSLADAQAFAEGVEDFAVSD